VNNFLFTSFATRSKNALRLGTCAISARNPWTAWDVAWKRFRYRISAARRLSRSAAARPRCTPNPRPSWAPRRLPFAVIRPGIRCGTTRRAVTPQTGLNGSNSLLLQRTDHETTCRRNEYHLRRKSKQTGAQATVCGMPGCDLNSSHHPPHRRHPARRTWCGPTRTCGLGGGSRLPARVCPHVVEQDTVRTGFARAEIGRRATPQEALIILAFARDRFGNDAGRFLRAAARAVKAQMATAATEAQPTLKVI